MGGCQASLTGKSISMDVNIALTVCQKPLKMGHEHKNDISGIGVRQRNPGG